MNTNTGNRQYSVELKGLVAFIAEQGVQEADLEAGTRTMAFMPKVFADDAYGQFLLAHGLTDPERIVLALALAAYLKPEILSLLHTQGNPAHLLQSPRTQLLMPTVETALWLLAGGDLEERVASLRIFDADHVFYRQSVLELGEPELHFPVYSSPLRLSPRFFELFVHDRFVRPRFSSEFPAHLLETALDWDDLHFNKGTRSRLEEVGAYLRHESRMRAELGLSRHMRQGYRVLFHGPSGTGKSIAATLIGKQLGKEVYRIDLSSVVSKYIGETSKNLHQLFATAEGKDWVLFFDEGDALLGQRQDASKTEGPGAHYANQDTAYLLQRIENYQGLVIVASNFKQNIDEAFTRRFQTMIYFDLPDHETALKVWEDNLPEQLPLAPDVNLALLVRQHSLSQAAILKVIQRAVLQSIMQDQPCIPRVVLERCLADESLMLKNFRP